MYVDILGGMGPCDPRSARPGGLIWARRSQRASALQRVMGPMGPHWASPPTPPIPPLYLYILFVNFSLLFLYIYTITNI